MWAVSPFFPEPVFWGGLPWEEGQTDRDRQRERHTHRDDAYTKKLKTIIKQKDIMSGGINE